MVRVYRPIGLLLRNRNGLRLNRLLFITGYRVAGYACGCAEIDTNKCCIPEPILDEILICRLGDQCLETQVAHVLSIER